MSDMCGARGPMPPAPAIGTRLTCTRNSRHKGQHVEANVGLGAWPRQSSLIGPDGVAVPVIDGGGQFPTVEARW